MTTFKTSLVLASVVAALAACGGGGGSDSPAVHGDPLDALPAEATQRSAHGSGFSLA